MSTTATASSGASQAAAPTNRPASASGHRPGAPAAGDSNLFSSLLGLLSATGDLPTDGAGLAGDDSPAGGKTLGQATDDPGEDPALALLPDATDNPLAALLAWPGAPVTMDAAELSGAAATGNERLAGQTGQTTATNADGTSGATPLPDDMTVLDQSTEPDAQTLAALSRTTAAPGNAGADALRNAQGQPPTATTDATGKASSRQAAWRSTTAIGNAAAQSVSTTLHAFNVSVTGHSDTLATQVRSTVTLDERFNAATTTAATLAPGQVGAGLVSAAMPGGDAGSGHTGQSGEQATPELAENNASEADASAPFETLAEEDAAGFGAWNPQSLRQASLRVGEGSEEAIDIRLSLAGEELSVDFRTDNAETRASLQQSAGAQLSDLLQRSGIQLGGVSVGAQQQGQGQGQPGQANEPGSQTGTRGPGAPAADAAASSAQAPVQPRPRSDGSQPLDMFV